MAKSFRADRLTAAAALVLFVACSRDARNATPDSTAGRGGPGQGNAGGASGAGAAGAGRGGRNNPTLTLAASDVGLVSRTLLEQGVPISGNLRPMETVNVRARLEGDLDGVFVREGEHVRRGQLLAKFEASQQQSGRTSAEADRESARSDLVTTEWNAQQSEELFKAGAIAETQLRAARQTVVGSRARLAAADARFRATSSDLQDTRVVAPVDGIIDKKLIESGERVARGAPLFSLVRAEVLELQANVPARNATSIRPGQVVRFVADGRRFDGRVDRVSPTIDPLSRSTTVYVRVPNATGTLKGGAFAAGRIVTRSIPAALVVPVAAVRQTADGGHPYVYRIDGRLLSQALITLGVVDESGGVAEVVEGLKDGDRVVVGNVGTLGKGMQVDILGAKQEGRGGRGAR